MNIISINDLNFKYKEKIVFENFDLDIKRNTITTIIGKNGSGKSTLVKLLIGLLPSKGKIKYNDEILDKENIKKLIGVVSKNCNDFNNDKTILEYLNLSLENVLYNKRKSKKRLNEIIDKFDLSEILNDSFNNLNDNQKYIVSMALALIYEPEILIIDEPLSYIDFDEKEKILNLLMELKENGLTIILVTQDIEDTLISDEIVFIDDKKVLLKGDKETVYKNEKTLNYLGYKLPFMVELSNRLKFYDLIDETIYDMQKMVDTLWK